MSLKRGSAAQRALQSEGEIEFSEDKKFPLAYGSMIVYTTIVLSYMQLRKLRLLANYVVYIVPWGANCSVA